jgi:uroporphyrin-3 C-methyltransferase|tara:strand:- start:379 stop:1575 length:1197 start_codon:yes stop_codon:yes gene_type:complete
VTDIVQQKQTKDTPSDASVVDAKVLSADKPKAKKSPRNNPKKGSSWGLIILLLASIGAGMAACYWGWQQLQLQRAQLGSQAQQLQRQQKTVTVLSQGMAQLQTDEQAAITAVLEQLQSVQQRLDSQNKRLLSMSTTSQEDWKLLEARYLLRLANQRLMTERDSVGSIAQLQAADNILRDLDDVALFSIRKAIAGDIAALKLAPNVDRDGVYLRLISLADNLKQLPAIKPLPKSLLNSQLRSPVMADDDALTIERTQHGADKSYWMHFKGWLSGLLNSASEHVRIRHFDTELKVLPPSSQRYVNQSVRLNLEQAQLALLGEKQAIYARSLLEAQQMLQNYYQLNDQVGGFIGEMKSLKQLQIRRSLPDISDSLAQLDAYIERLHKLQPKSVVSRNVPEA